MKAQLLQWKRVTSSQREPTHKKLLKPVCLAIARLRPNESIGREERSTSIQASCVPPPGCKSAPSGNQTRVKGLKAYSTPLCRRGLPWMARKGSIEPLTWAWKGFAGIKNTMRNTPLTPLTPQPNPQPNPQTTPPINETPPNNDKKTPFPIIVVQKTSETTVFGNSAASTYWKHSSCSERESRLFPTWRANPQKTSETSVFGNSAAST